MRNILATVPKGAQESVAAFVRTIFYQADHGSAMEQLKEVAATLSKRFPQAAELLEDASEDLLSHLHFPPEHRRRLHPTNPLERLHKEIKRRTYMIGIFPNRASLLRLVGTLLQEQDDEMAGRRPPLLQPGLDGQDRRPEGGVSQKELLAAIA